MENLELKKAIFNPTKIVLLRKKGDIIINIDNIRKISYRKPTFFSFFLSGLVGSYPNGPGVMVIWLKQKINKRDFYSMNIRYKNVLLLPEIYREMIDFSIM